MATKLNLKDYITTIPDFPKEGIMFRDVTTIISDGKAFEYACDQIAEFAKENGAEVIAGPESRGFIFGCPVSTKLGLGFVPIRKPGKLPREVISESYDLEYGSNTLCMHADAIKTGQKVVIVDDLLATGGTIEAAIKLVQKLGGVVVGLAFVIELVDLKGREKFKGCKVLSLTQYEGE